MATINSVLIEKIFSLSRLMKENMSYSSDLIHLSLLQLQTLIFLRNNKDAQMRDVASQFNIEMPTATNLIATLARKKLVLRKTDQADRRLVRICLTPKGDGLLSDAMRARGKKMTVLLSYLSKHEKESLLKMTTLLIEKMEVMHEEK